MNNVKKNLLIASLLISGSIIVTGCNTVKGTVHGASRDINEVVSAVDQPAPKQRVVRKSTHTSHTYKGKKKAVVMNKSATQTTTVKSSSHDNHNMQKPSTTSTTTTTKSTNSSLESTDN